MIFSSLSAKVLLKDSVLSSSEVLIRISDNESYVANKTGAQDLGNGSFAWQGKVDGVEGGVLSFSKVSNVYRGSISLGVNLFYQISSDEGIPSIKKVSINNRKPCASCVQNEKHLSSFS